MRTWFSLSLREELLILPLFTGQTYNFNYNTIPEFLQTARVLEGVGVG